MWCNVRAINTGEGAGVVQTIGACSRRLSTLVDGVLLVPQQIDTFWMLPRSGLGFERQSSSQLERAGSYTDSRVLSSNTEHIVITL